MKFSSSLYYIYIIYLCLFSSCGGGSSGNGGSGSATPQSCSAVAYNPIDLGLVPNTALSNVMLLAVGASDAPGTPSAPGAYCDLSCSTVSNPAACASSSTYAGRPCPYTNEVMTTVTLCQPGSTTVCQTFSNVLVDTGSSGLRMFTNAQDNNGVPLVGSAASVFPAAPAPAASFWDCVEYGDGSSEWGQVQPVDIWLGSGAPTSSTPGEVAANTAIQLIQYDPTGVGSTYCPPASGGVADTSPQQSGFTGIMGVGLQPYDCNLSLGCQGTLGCTPAQEAAGTCLASGYYQCTGAGGTSCTVASPTLNSQLVRNPVTALPVDNNGIIMAFTGNIPVAGTTSISGYLTLGIGTQANNQMAPQVTQYSVFPFNSTNLQNGTVGTFATNFSSTDLVGIIDSGSNFYYLPPPSSGVLPICSNDPSQMFFCPATTQSLVAVNTGSDGSTSGCINFQIANADNSYLNAANTSSVFNNIGATSGALQTGGSFDWGFPFFLGKSVYVGFDGLSVPPYWAY